VWSVCVVCVYVNVCVVCVCGMCVVCLCMCVVCMCVCAASSCVYHFVIMHSPSNCFFLFFYLWYSGISRLSPRERLLPLFPSVVALSFSAPSSESPGIRTLRFYFCCCSIFHTVVCFTLLFISSIILFIFYLENDGRKMAALLPVGYYFQTRFCTHTVLCWESELVCLPYWHPVTKHTFSNMYTNLFSLYMCVSLFLWPMGVCVEWDVTGRLPCYTHKSNSIFFFFHRSDMMPQADHSSTSTEPCMCVVLKPLF